MTALADIDAKLLTVHADYLRAERRGDLDDAATLLELLDRLLDERLHLPQQRLPADTDGHNPPSMVR